MTDIQLIDAKEQPAFTVRERVKNSDIPTAMGRMYGELVGFMQRKGVQVAGPPFAYYHSWSDQEVDLECGFPVAAPVSGEGKVKPFTLPAVKAVTAMHVGPYHKLMETYTEAERWMRANGHEPATYMWELYLNEPNKVPPEQLMTQIFWPIK